MSRWAWVIAACGALAMAGCERPPDPAVDASVPVVPDAAPLASNELSRLGRRDLKAGDNGLAEQHFREAVERNGADGYAWLGLAAAYDNLKRFDLADRAYAEAARLQGETPSVVNNLGYSYYLRGERARALTQLQHAATLYPDNPAIQNNIGLVSAGERPNSHAAP